MNCNTQGLHIIIGVNEARGLLGLAKSFKSLLVHKSSIHLELVENISDCLVR